MTLATDKPFDLGLQAERTALSWQRTTLALAVGILVASRLLAETSSALSYVVAGTGLVIMTVLFVLGNQRYRSTHGRLVGSPDGRVALVSAIPLFLWAVIAFCLALLGFGFAIVVALTR